MILVRLIGLMTAMLVIELSSSIGASAQTSLPEVMKIQEIVASGGKAMTGQQIVAMVSGNTAYHVFLTPFFGRPRGSVEPVYYRDARTRVQGWKGKPVERLWWMEGDALCAESPDHSARICSPFLDLNGTVFSCNLDLNVCRSIVRMVPGNPERW
jgi:hypothetical protein